MAAEVSSVIAEVVASLPLKLWQALVLLALSLLLYLTGGRIRRLWRIWRAHRGLPAPSYSHLLLGHIPKVQRRGLVPLH